MLAVSERFAVDSCFTTGTRLAADDGFPLRSSQRTFISSVVRRCGFRITHAQFFTSTASQGLTLRAGTIIDCARLPEMDDENWWLHLYVMFSRVTSMDDMLLLRPPPRDILELGPPVAIRDKVAQFQERAQICRAGIAARQSSVT